LENFYKNAQHLLKSKNYDEVRHLIDDIVENRISPIVEKYTKKELHYHHGTIRTFILKNFPDDWKIRFDKIKMIGRDSSSLSSLVLRYGEEDGYQKFIEKGKNCAHTIENYKKWYGLGWEEKWKDMCSSKYCFSERYYTEKYGDDVGRKMWDNILNKKLNSHLENYIKNGSYQNNGRSLTSYQERFGIFEGYIKWRKSYDIVSYKNSKQRYIDEYGFLDGVNICKNIKDNASLKAYINRYGEEVGFIKYKEKCDKCGITIEKMIQKYGEDDGKYRYEKWLRNSAIGSLQTKSYSKSSQDLFWSLYEKIEPKEKSKVYFAELNEEYRIILNVDDIPRIYRLDFKLDMFNIEFDCKYWHDVDKDKIRDASLKELGYKILRVDYDDFIKSQQKIIDKCLDFLYERK